MEPKAIPFKDINDPFLKLKGEVLVALQGQPETELKVLGRIYLVVANADLLAGLLDGPFSQSGVMSED